MKRISFSRRFFCLFTFANCCLFNNREPRTSCFNTRMSELIIFVRQNAVKNGLYCQILNVFSRHSNRLPFHSGRAKTISHSYFTWHEISAENDWLKWNKLRTCEIEDSIIQFEVDLIGYPVHTTEYLDDLCVVGKNALVTENENFCV